MTASNPCSGSAADDAEHAGTAPGADSAAEGVPHAVPMRIQRFLARAGVSSRRGSENLMTAGRVTVNGHIVTELGAKVDPASDRVEVDGMPVRLSDSPVYLALNKPSGYVSTMSDPHARRTVAELVPTEEHPGLFPIGRLDMDTTGLLLFTTDGDLGFRLLHPRFHVTKTYKVVADGRVGAEDVERLRGGIELEDGLTAPAKVDLLEAGETSRVEIAIREGRKRQVRRMFSAVGHPVLELHRTRFGPVEIEELEPGASRTLDTSEIRELKRVAGLGDAERLASGAPPGPRPRGETGD